MNPLRSVIYTLIALVLFACGSTKKSVELELTKMKTKFESNHNYSASYEEVIPYYQKLASRYSTLSIEPYGVTDSGKPLHEIIISDRSVYDRGSADKYEKLVLFINNAIHPGEPCGVDASMMLARDLVSKPTFKNLLEHAVIVIVPVYNISGALNRSGTSRANQDGPEAYGFRGNIRNYDLNRDFIKADTHNAQSFNQLFNKWDPDILIDNHTSNGADYQYVITLIATQKDKLNRNIGQYMQKEILPELYAGMEQDGYEMTPYVYARNTPDDGIYGFLDLPRYSSGYAALHNTISFMPETHMLKPYKDRVMSTYYFMKNMLHYISSHKTDILSVRDAAKKEISSLKMMDINWELDESQVDEITFKGYEAKYKPSEITGKDRLYYDHNAPYSKTIKHFNSYKPSLSVIKPSAYIIPQAYTEVIERLEWNNVNMERLEMDTVLEVEMYHIENLESRRSAYEGHFLHSKVEVSTSTKNMKYYQGDILVKTGQEKDRYIVETLEPQGPDSFFAWNFFDGILMRKEYFSSYVFEDLAVEILAKNPELKNDFEKKKTDDSDFAQNPRAQLNFIYQNSEYAEPTYKRYPVGRIMDK